MATMGRGSAALARQKAVELKEADRVRRAVEPLAETPPLPEHLGSAGRRVWEAFWPERLKTVTQAEVHIFTRYCELQDRRHELVQLVKTTGWSVQGSRPGMLVRRAEADVLMETERELRQMERVLGLAPAHRAKLQIDVLQVEDRLAKAGARRLSSLVEAT